MGDYSYVSGKKYLGSRSYRHFYRGGKSRLNGNARFH